MVAHHEGAAALRDEAPALVEFARAMIVDEDRQIDVAAAAPLRFVDPPLHHRGGKTPALPGLEHVELPQFDGGTARLERKGGRAPPGHAQPPPLPFRDKT